MKVLQTGMGSLEGRKNSEIESERFLREVVAWGRRGFKGRRSTSGVLFLCIKGSVDSSIPWTPSASKASANIRKPLSNYDSLTLLHNMGTSAHGPDCQLQIMEDLIDHKNLTRLKVGQSLCWKTAFRPSWWKLGQLFFAQLSEHLDEAWTAILNSFQNVFQSYAVMEFFIQDATLYACDSRALSYVCRCHTTSSCR